MKLRLLRDMHLIEEIDASLVSGYEEALVLIRNGECFAFLGDWDKNRRDRRNYLKITHVEYPALPLPEYVPPLGWKYGWSKEVAEDVVQNVRALMVEALVDQKTPAPLKKKIQHALRRATDYEILDVQRNATLSQEKKRIRVECYSSLPRRFLHRDYQCGPVNICSTLN